MFIDILCYQISAREFQNEWPLLTLYSSLKTMKCMTIRPSHDYRVHARRQGSVGEVNIIMIWYMKQIFSLLRVDSTYNIQYSLKVIHSSLPPSRYRRWHQRPWFIYDGALLDHGQISAWSHNYRIKRHRHFPIAGHTNISAHHHQSMNDKLLFDIELIRYRVVTFRAL